MEKFDKNKYEIQYTKEHYDIFKVKLKKENNKELEEILQEEKMTKASFLRKAIELLKKDRKLFK